MFLLVLVSVIFISSCTNGGTSGPETRTGGVDMGFLLNRPPLDEISEGQSFTVGVTLTNNIPRDVDCELCVSDTPSDNFGGIPGSDCRDIDIKSAQLINEEIIPEMKEVYFPGGDNTYSYNNLPFGADTTEIRATLTYNIVSRTSAFICLIKDPTIEIPGVECDYQESFSYNDLKRDYAPVSVDRVEKSIVPEGTKNRLILDITLKKNQQGDIVSGSYSNDENMLVLDVNLAGTDADFICTPTKGDKVKMDESSKEVKCVSTFKMDQDYYEDSLDISLSYTYRTVINTGSIDLNKKEEIY